MLLIIWDLEILSQSSDITTNGEILNFKDLSKLKRYKKPRKKEAGKR
jgi:hypothetical protein